MGDEERTKEDLIYEISYLRLLIAELESKYKQSEEVLKVITDQYRHITSAVSDYLFSVYMVDGKPVETVHGPGCLAITGHSPEDFSENRYLWIQMVCDEDRSAVLKHVANILSGLDVKPLEHRIVRKDGMMRWVRNTPVCQYDAEGKLIAYDGLIQDITERRMAEEALRRSEEKYRMVADFTCDWEHWIDPDGYYIYVSPSCERITGYRPEEFMNDPALLLKIVHPDDHELVMKHYAEAFRESNEESHFDFRIITRAGQVCWISHNCRSVYSDDGNWLGRRGSNRDITKRKRLEEELLSARNLEFLGILSAGIAQDFNHLLWLILHDVSFAKTYVAADDELHKFLESIEKTALRASEMTRQLVSLSQKGGLAKKLTSIGDIIKTAAESELSGTAITYEADIPEDLWFAEVDQTHMGQVICHIISNARNAIINGGVITIRAKNLSDGAQESSRLKNERYVKISIADTGIGIPEEDLPKIFDPYFSVRERTGEEKAGLGLTLCYAVIKNHRGDIVVESKIGEGTTFHIYLPVCQQEETTKNKAAQGYRVPSAA